jgi:catechol 1,2-dioxygenase
MSDSLLDTPEVQTLLTRAAGLDTDKGDARVKRIVHRVVSDLFRTIEDFDVQSDEFWSAMGYLTALGQASEVGLLVPGLGLETFVDLRMGGGAQGRARWPHAAHHRGPALHRRRAALDGRGPPRRRQRAG